MATRRWLPIAASSQKAERLRILQHAGGEMHAVQTRYQYPGNTAVDVIFGLDRIVGDTYMATLRAELRATLLKILAIAAACLIVLGISQVKWFIAPVRAMQRAVARLKSGEDERIEQYFPTEVQALADEVNHLVEQINSVVNCYRNFSGNRAHSLRTPWTTIRNETDLGVIREKVETMRRIIDRNLARADAVGTGVRGRGATRVQPVLEKLSGYRRSKKTW